MFTILIDFIVRMEIDINLKSNTDGTLGILSSTAALAHVLDIIVLKAVGIHGSADIVYQGISEIALRAETVGVERTVIINSERWIYTISLLEGKSGYTTLTFSIIQVISCTKSANCRTRSINDIVSVNTQRANSIVGVQAVRNGNLNKDSTSVSLKSVALIAAGAGSLIV